MYYSFLIRLLISWSYLVNVCGTTNLIGGSLIPSVTSRWNRISDATVDTANAADARAALRGAALRAALHQLLPATPTPAED